MGRKLSARLAIQILPPAGMVAPAGRVIAPEPALICQPPTTAGATLVLIRRTASSEFVALSACV
jgi:hypothetical protein